MLYSNNKFVYFTVQSLRHLHISAGEQATNSLLRLLAPLTSFIFIALGQPLPVPSAKLLHCREKQARYIDPKTQSTNSHFNPLGGKRDKWLRIAKPLSFLLSRAGH